MALPMSRYNTAPIPALQGSVSIQLTSMRIAVFQCTPLILSAAPTPIIDEDIICPVLSEIPSEVAVIMTRLVVNCATTE